MRRRWLVVIPAIVLLVLGGRAVWSRKSYGQDRMVFLAPPQGEAPKDAPAKRWRTAGAPMTKADEPAAVMPKVVGPAELAVGDDPMGAVDTFLQRSRKEADDSIQALTQEAETLRARLQKVEAALARWKGVSEALAQEPKPGAVEGGSPKLVPEALPMKVDGGLPPVVSEPTKEPGPQLEPTPAPAEPQILPPPAEEKSPPPIPVPK